MGMIEKTFEVEVRTYEIMNLEAQDLEVKFENHLASNEYKLSTGFQFLGREGFLDDSKPLKNEELMKSLKSNDQLGKRA